MRLKTTKPLNSLVATLIGASALALLGFFVDFQLFKARVEAVEKKVQKIDEVKALNTVLSTQNSNRHGG